MVTRHLRRACSSSSRASSVRSRSCSRRHACEPRSASTHTTCARRSLSTRRARPARVRRERVFSVMHQFCQPHLACPNSIYSFVSRLVSSHSTLILTPIPALSGPAAPRASDLHAELRNAQSCLRFGVNKPNKFGVGQRRIVYIYPKLALVRSVNHGVSYTDHDLAALVKVRSIIRQMRV